METLLALLFLFIVMPLLAFVTVIAVGLGFHFTQSIIEYMKIRETELLENIDENAKKKAKSTKDK